MRQCWPRYRDLHLVGANKLDNRPALADVARNFRGAKMVAVVGAIGLTFVLIIFWPAIMTVTGVLTIVHFKQWVSASGGEFCIYIYAVSFQAAII